MSETSVPAVNEQRVLEGFVGAYVGGAGERFSLERRGVFLHAVGDRVGLALPWGGRLVVVWGPLNKTEIGAYTVQGTKVMGLWVPPGADQGDYSACGVERSVVEGGAWRITSAFAIDKSVYAGKVIRTPRGGAVGGGGGGQPMGMKWELEDGVFESFGIDFGDAVYSTFCFEPEKPHALGVYDVKSLAGVAMDSGGRVWGDSLRRGK